MATSHIYIEKTSATPNAAAEIAKQREQALARMVMTYIGTGLAFMLLPGTLLGVWNLLSISGQRASSSVSPAWIQAHGHAQVFGWIGTFILGIGFYSIPKMRRAHSFAMWEAWACWVMWTAGVVLRWVSTVYSWHWRAALPISAALELLAFALFFKTVSSHRPVRTGETKPKLGRWIVVVITGTVGLFSTLVANLVGCIDLSLHSSSPAFGQTFDQRFLVLMSWGFMVPFVWGFSARWLSVFVGVRPPCEKGLTLLVGLNTVGVIAATLGIFKVAVFLFFIASIMSLLALRVAFRAVQPGKVQRIHSSFPYFIRLAYAWLVIAALLGIWAALSQHPDGIWGASRHALTVGFVATMVFAIGQRVLPAFSGMRFLFSSKLMGIGLFLLATGCFLRVSSEILAYNAIVQAAWKWLPVSAVVELAAVTTFALNIVATFLTAPPSRFVQIK